MTAILSGYRKFMNVIVWIEKIFLAVTGAILLIVVMYQVILRYVFSAANSWTDELARYLFIYDALIASALAITENRHMQVDVLINLLKPKARCIADIIATVVGMVFMVFLFKYGLDLCITALPNVSPGVGVSMTVPYTCIPIGCVLMFLASILFILERLEDLKELNNAGGGQNK